MNLIQQFLEENLSRDLNHQILQQIQNENSAIQSLVTHLEDLRQRENAQNIQIKIKRIQKFLQLKKQVISSMQSLSVKGAPMFSWILDNLMQNNFLYQLVKREEFLVQKQLTEIGKRIFIENSNFQQLHEDIEFGNKLIRQLNILSQDKSQIGKALSRENIKEIDAAVKIFEDKIKVFEQKIGDFNTAMLIFLRKLYSFEQKIKTEFHLAFNTTQNLQIVSNAGFQNQSISPESIQQSQGILRLNNSKSYLSVNSKEHESRVNFNKTNYQQTPKSFFETQKFNPIQTFKQEKSKLVLEKRSSANNQDRYSNYSKNQNLQSKNSVLQNRRTSVDLKGRMPKNSQISCPDEIYNMNKTLSAFNFYKPDVNNIGYATNEFGRQVRLPTKWASNSRSSISYYPPQ